MTWRIWFEEIRAKAAEVAGLEAELEQARAMAGPKGQRFDAMGHGGAKDRADAIVHALQLGERLDRARIRIEPLLDAAEEVLYGEGGVAELRGSTDADILCGYYLQGMGWRQVAEEVAGSQAAVPRHWCRMRAMRALEWMEANIER